MLTPPVQNSPVRNLRNAILQGANLKEADLSGALNLTEEQLTAAIVDERTLLPAHLANLVRSGFANS